MGEGRAGDGLIKLFGKTIPVPETAAVGEAAKDIQQSGGSGSGTTDPKGQENNVQDSTGSPPQQEVADTEDSSADKQQGEAGNPKEKLKKPDKILPCPRCNSMDTKFCYYNNYNINQPRHFCKNCQRYWTAGGAMRNVPVGAGRRKSKSASATSHFLQRVRAGLPVDPLVCAAAKTNGTVLSFGSAMSSLDLTEQMKQLKEKLVPIAGDERSVGSRNQGPSAKAEDPDRKENVTADKSARVVQHPCMTNGVAMWPFSCAPPVPASACYGPGSIAIPFYPAAAAAAAYWGCMVPGAWSGAWPPHSGQSETGSSITSASPAASTKSNICFTPGKHPRDRDEEGGAKGNGKVWVPKTIRIDDVDEVARSSILSLIGIGGDKAGKDGGRGCKLARVFEQNEEAARTATPHSAAISGLPFLQGNPAALSRSLTFQEGS